MIGWLGGIVRVRDAIAGEVVLDVGGVGYQVAVSWQTFAVLPEVGAPAELWIHTHVREDVLALFGFATPAEKRMFRLLLSVPQVGPKAALGVLGGFPLAELCAAIAGGEAATLERIPGVGKRTAERILLDLREKVTAVLEGLAPPSDAQKPAAAASTDDRLRDEAKGVLVNLGWKPKTVDAALAKIEMPADASLDDIVRRTLAILMAR